MNAANEEAVFAFLNKEIKFLDIYEITKKIFNEYTPIENATIEQILDEDIKIRTKTKELIQEKRAL